MKRKTKKCSIVGALLEMQTGVGRRNIYQARCRLLRCLLRSPVRQFREVYHFSTRGPSMFTLLHCGRLLVQEGDKVRCLSACEPDTNLYHFRARFQCKDLVVWCHDSPLSTQALLDQKGRHTTSLLYLTSTKHLERRCALTGRLCESIYLSPHLSFTELQCDPESDLIVIKSTRQSGDTLLTLALFSSPPLTFQAMFEVRKSVFGARAVDAGVQQGVLFVRHSDDKVRLYSFEQIISESQQLARTEGSGLPLTLEVTEEPRLLLEVSSVQGELTLGGNPYHIITRPSSHITQVTRLDSGQLVASVDTPDIQMENEHVFFHPDESSRLMHLNNNTFRVSWLEAGGLTPWLLHESDAAAPAPHALVSRYGRVLKPRLEKEERQQELSLIYEPESDVLALLRASEDTKGHGILDQVLLFDNCNGEVMRRVDPQGFQVAAPFDTSSFSLHLEWSSLLVLVKHREQTFGWLACLMENLP